MSRNGCLDLSNQLLACAVGRDHNFAELLRAGVAGQHVEQVADVLGDIWISGQQPEVLVNAGSLGVVITGADVHVAAHALAFAPHDHQCLGVCLEARKPVADVCPRLFKRPNPTDVLALVKARLYLDDAHSLLALFGCFN